METNLRFASPDTYRLNRVGSGTHVRSLAWLFCLMSLLALCLIPRLGGVAAALFMLPWAVLAVRKSSLAIASLVENLPLFLIPLFALISFAWSQDPEFTFRAGIQLLLTNVIAIWAGSLILPRTFISALLSALTIINIAGFALDEGASFQGAALIGVFESKNAFAFHSLIQLLAGLAVIGDRAQPASMRLIALAAVLLAPVFLIQAQSTGALIFGAPAILMCFLVPALSRLSTSTRAAIMAVAIFTVVSTLIAVAALVDDLGAVLDALGKDSTLTGRSYLWQRARDFIEAAPLLGAGYQAFWRVGNPPAEELWFASHVASGAGFNFHNLYLHVGVDLGYIGMGLVILTIAWLALRLSWAIIIAPSSVIFATAIFVYMFPVTFIEVGFLYQFHLGQVLFCIVWVYTGTRRLSHNSSPSMDCTLKTRRAASYPETSSRLAKAGNHQPLR